MGQFNLALELFDKEFEPVDILHVRYGRRDANILLHDGLNVLHRKVIVILVLSGALWAQDNRE